MIDNNSYNPIIPEETPAQGSPSLDSLNAEKNKDLSTWQQTKNFFSSTRTRLALGAVLCLIGVFLTLAFISFLSAGPEDESLVLSQSAVQIANSGTQTKNAGAALGASVAHYFITESVGLSAFVIVLWCIVIGVRLLRMKRVFFFSFTLLSLLSMFSLSMLLGAISLYAQELTFFPLGGYLGLYANKYLTLFIGEIGMILTNFLIIFLWILICYKTLHNVYMVIKRVLPRRPQSHTDNEDAIPSEFLGDSKPEAVGPNAIDDEPITEEPTVEDGGSLFPDLPVVEKPTRKRVKRVHSEENEGDEVSETIVAGEIVKADEINQQLYDPTADLPHFKMPTIDLLREIANNNTVSDEEREANKQRIIEMLRSFDVEIKRIDMQIGPTFTLFEVVQKEGVRIAKIKSLGDDLAQQLTATGIRIIAPMPGRGTIGIEVPNSKRQTVSMRSVIESKAFQETKCTLPMVLGCTVQNEVFIADLAKMPHLLVAGATGQGKSVGLNAIVASLLYKKHPTELKFVLVDPKVVEFSLYAKLEHHYLAKLPQQDKCIITESDKVVATLNSLVQEMEDRYQLLNDAGERNIKDYNAKFVTHSLNPEKGHHYMPYIVVIIDEYGDLMMVAGKEIETPIVRIAQKARAVGIHMIIATQRPSADIVTGKIKANFPGRIAFRVSAMVDSRTILDVSGAQHLVGMGDMLFSSNGDITRVQCPFIDTPEVKNVCAFIGDQIGFEEAYPLPDYVPPGGEGGAGGGGGSISDRDPLFEEAAAFIVSGEVASTSSLQRKYSIGYNRAGRLMDQLEMAGIVGPAQGAKPRRVLVDSIQLTNLLNGQA